MGGGGEEHGNKGPKGGANIEGPEKIGGTGRPPQNNQKKGGKAF